MDNLKPCPFCGGEAETWDDGALWHVICKSKDCAAMSSPCFTEADAVVAWNKRAERTCHSEYPDRWECSECGFLDAYTTADFINYCPSCGARVVSE